MLSFTGLGFSTMVSFLIVFILFTGAGSLLILPAVIYSRIRGREDSWLLPFLHAPAIVILYLLHVFNVGAQASLGNMLEFQIVVVATVIVVYIKVFIVDPVTRDPRVGTRVCAGLLVGMAIVLRLVTPTLQE